MLRKNRLLRALILSEVNCIRKAYKIPKVELA